MPETTAKVPLWAGLAAPLALALGALAALSAKNAPGFSLILTLAAGALLALASRQLAPQAGQLPRHSAPRESWEPWFGLLLLASAIWARFHALDTIPAGAGGAEAEIAGRTSQLLGGEPYVPYLRDGDINWGTLSFYLGGFFAKHLGWGPGSFRLASACWGALSVAAFWVVARRISSPLAAASAALLYSALHVHLHYSRHFFPGIQLTVSPLLALGLYIEGWRRSKGSWLLAAGAVLALGLYGYTPGRILPLTFAAWFAGLLLLRSEAFPGWKGLAWFWSGFILAAMPVGLWAIANPDGYMGLIQHHNAYGGHGLLGYLRAFWENLPTYLKLWTVVGDPTQVEGVVGRPALDPVAAVLLPLGAAFALFLALRPLPLLLLGGVLAGLLPAMMGGGFAHPTIRRTILAYPPAFLLLAMGLDQLKFGFQRLGGRRLVQIFGLALFAAGAWTTQDAWKRYFVTFMGDPEVQARYGKRYYVWGQSLRTTGQREVITQQGMVAYVVSGLLTPPGLLRSTANSQEDILALPAGPSYRLALDPYAQSLLPWLSRTLPGCVPQVISETTAVDSVYSDPFNPLVYGVNVDVDPESVAELHRLRVEGSRQRLDPFAADFGAKHRGKRLLLRGALVAPPWRAGISAECAWPGVKVKVAGQALSSTAKVLPAYGLLPLEISLKVPAQASGPLPLRLLMQGAELVGQGRVNGLDLSRGLRAEYFAGGEWVKGEKPVASRLEPVPLMRYYDNPYFSSPFHTRWRGSFVPARSGEYRFSVPVIQAEIFVAGGKAFARNYPTTTVKALKLRAGQPVSLDLRAVLAGGAMQRTLMLMVQGPGEDKPSPADPALLRPAR